MIKPSHILLTIVIGTAILLITFFLIVDSKYPQEGFIKSSKIGLNENI